MGATPPRSLTRATRWGAKLNLYHDQNQFCNAHYENAQVDLGSLLQAAEPKKPRRKPQGATERAERLAVIQDARSAAAHAEADAGPALRAQIEDEKALERACDGASLREEMTRRLIFQRAGLLKLCNVESSNADFDRPTARVRLYLDHMLMLSANVAVLSGSGWQSVWGWLHDRLPLPSDKIGEGVLEARFNVLMSEAAAQIASRHTVRLWDLRTAPSSSMIAETFGTTMAQLRAAKATRYRLTAIDSVRKKDRDRARMEEKRRDAGMMPQSERNTRQRDEELAVLAGCTDRWVRKLRLSGKLAAYLAKKGIDVPEAATSTVSDDSSQKCRGYKEFKTRQIWELPQMVVGRSRPVPRPRRVPMTFTSSRPMARQSMLAA